MAPLRSLVILVAAAALAAPALAHPKLLSTTPAARSTVASPTRIMLAFSEALMPQLSGLDVVTAAKPGTTKHAPTKIADLKTSVSRDGKRLVATLPKALPAGAYDVRWHAVSVDTHRVEGHFVFTVR
jgi:methionine-rich copper-binding protein CopC